MAALKNVLQNHVWRGGSPAAGHDAVSTGYDALDGVLPGGGWPAGALTEILREKDGFGELQLVMPALAELTRQRRRVAWLAPPHLPYAPALAAAGMDLEYLVVVRAPGRRDALWAAEQVLRAGACHALLAWLPDARYAELRRLSVAMEGSPGIALLFRPPAAAAEASPACLRLALEAHEGRLAARILKRRGEPVFSPVDIPVKKPVDAVACAPLPAAPARIAAARPRLVPVLG